MNETEQLKNQVKQLMDWKKEKERQQIKFPLDQNSIEVLNKYFLRVTDVVTLVGGAAGNSFGYFKVKQDNLKGIFSQDKSQLFTVAPSSDTFTVLDQPYENDTVIYFQSSDTLPSPLGSGTTYYVVQSSGLTFKVSATPGGAQINILDTGTGTHYVDYI